MAKIKIPLSDGRIATLKEGKGRDLFEAMRLASEPGEITKLLIARLVQIDGKDITENELDELPIQDVMEITKAFTENFTQSRTQKPSS